MNNESLSILNRYGAITFSPIAPIAYFYNDDGLFYVSPTHQSKEIALHELVGYLEELMMETVLAVEKNNDHDHQ